MKFVKLWIDRCKVKYSLAFSQFRSILPEANIEGLEEFFNGHKKFLERIVIKVE